MAVSVSIQETTVVPAGDGYIVQLYVSDKPPAGEEDADLALTLRVRIDRTGTARLAGIQNKALAALETALQPVRNALMDKLQSMGGD